MTTLTRKTAREIVDDTRTILIHRGWSRLDSVDAEGRVDLFGALCKADIVDSPAWQEAYNAILWVAQATSLTAWNIAPGRTANQVLHLLAEVDTYLAVGEAFKGGE